MSPTQIVRDLQNRSNLFEGLDSQTLGRYMEKVNGKRGWSKDTLRKVAEANAYKAAPSTRIGILVSLLQLPFGRHMTLIDLRTAW